MWPYYIHEKPVKAGLIARAAEWQWSSAWEGSATAGILPLSDSVKKGRA
jgi:hypothetical protein